MKHLTAIVIILAALGSGVASYLYANESTAPTPPPPARPPVSHLLDLTPEQERLINAADPTFSADAADLAERLDAEQAALATLLEDETSGKEETLAQVEAVIGAHNTLERRVATHVLDVREHLTGDQRKKLMCLLAGTVRSTQGRMERCRRGRGRGLGQGPGQGLGQGQGPGPGRGRGGQGQGRGRWQREDAKD